MAALPHGAPGTANLVGGKGRGGVSRRELGAVCRATIAGFPEGTHLSLRHPGHPLAAHSRG